MIRWTSRAVIVIAAVLVGCTPAATPPAPQPGGAAQPTATRSTNQVMRFAKAGFPTSATPESSSANNDIFSAQFDSMMLLDAKFNLQPYIATKWEFQPNLPGWRFTLRNDLTFSNGDKLTADDVEFTANQILNGTPPLPQRALVAKMTAARKVDDTTVDFVTQGPDSSLLYGMPYVFIYPKKYYESVGKDSFNTKPIGSGPYELAEYRATDTLNYKLRAGYTHPFRKPIASEVRWKNIPDSTAMYNGIRLGEIDAGFNGLSVDQVTAAERDGNVVIKTDLTSVLVAIDQKSNQRLNTPLMNLKVRQALNYAIDRDTISKSLYKGTAQPLNQVAIPGTPAYNPNLPTYAYDVAKAKQLLAEAGYPNGFKVANPIDYVPSGLSTPVFLAIQDQWKQIGVEVTLQTNELGVWVDKFYNRNNQIRNELISSGGSDATGIMSFFRGFITCNQPELRQIWCVPAFDTYMDQAYAEPDATKRAALLQEAIKAHQAEVTYVYIVATPGFIIASPKLKDMRVDQSTFWKPDYVYRVD